MVWNRQKNRIFLNNFGIKNILQITKCVSNKTQTLYIYSGEMYGQVYIYIHVGKSI